MNPPLTATGPPPDDTAALLNTPAAAAGVYKLYRVTFHYVGASGQSVPPGTGAGDQPDVGKVVTLHGKKMTCKLEWAASCAGGPVQAPSLYPADPDLVLGAFGFSADGMDVGANGVDIVNTAAGWAGYGVIDPNKVVLAAPITPRLDHSLVAPLAVAAVTFGGGRFPATGAGSTRSLRAGGASAGDIGSGVAGGGLGGVSAP